MIFSDPDPTFQLVSNPHPDPVSDPTVSFSDLFYFKFISDPE